MIDQIGFNPFRQSEASPSAVKKSGGAEGSQFLEILKAGIVKVNEVQTEADTMAMRLALGEVDDVSEVSIAVEKAELALRLMVQIRDKLVDAYQQIARMSV